MLISILLGVFSTLLMAFGLLIYNLKSKILGIIIWSIALVIYGQGFVLFLINLHIIKLL